jgi:hypothetical protein
VVLAVKCLDGQVFVVRRGSVWGVVRAGGLVFVLANAKWARVSRWCGWKGCAVGLLGFGRGGADLKHPGFDAHLVSPDRCASPSDRERSTQLRLPTVRWARSAYPIPLPPGLFRPLGRPTTNLPDRGTLAMQYESAGNAVTERSAARAAWRYAEHSIGL